KEFNGYDALKIYEALSSPTNKAHQDRVQTMAIKNGMLFIRDSSGTGIDVQIFDTAKFADGGVCRYELPKDLPDEKKPVIFVMDYAFGEQAFETIDELLKPYAIRKNQL